MDLNGFVQVNERDPESLMKETAWLIKWARRYIYI